MNIVLVAPVWPYLGGISHFNTILFDQLSKDHNVHLISWKKRFPDFLYPGKTQIEADKHHIIEHDPRFSIHILNPFTWLKPVILAKKKKADLLLLNWVSPLLTPVFFFQLILLKLFTQSKSLLICHNVMPHENRIFDKICTKAVFSLTDYFLVHSESELQLLKRLKPNPKSILGFHPEYALFREKQIKRNLKNLLNLPDKVILYFGYIRPYKGVEYLIRALPGVLEKFKCHLIIAGEFWENQKRYTDLIAKLNIQDHISIVDEYIPDEDVGNYFETADVVVLPYQSVSQSGIAQIAYVFRKPVITTNTGGLADIVKDGETGYIVEPKNFLAIQNAIIKFFEDKSGPIFSENISKFQKRFSWDKYVHLITETYSN